MIARLGILVSRLAARFFPDPFVIAILLSALTLVLALTLGGFGSKPPDTAPLMWLIEAWRSERGLWMFLAFGMQMCLVLVSGHALAASQPVAGLLRRLAARARSTSGAVVITALVASLCSILNWGLGLIVGALLAREMGRSLHQRGLAHHYPLIVAAGFVGFLPWHGGLSGSGPLTMTSAQGMSKVLPAQTIEALAAAGHAGGVPLSQTIFSPLNLIVTGGLVVLAPICLVLLAPRRDEEMVAMSRLAPALANDPVAQPSTTDPASDEPGIGPCLDRSRAINILLAVALLAAAAAYQFGDGVANAASRLQRIGLNEVNVLCIGFGLLLHRSPRSYLAAVEEGARGCAGIILQFPIYGGIVAMLVASGLDRQIAGLVNAIAGERTLPVWTFLAAGVINMFVPSGGGQWGVQGPIALESGLALGVPPGRMIMSVAYGDQVTNMLQVFWALPLLAITGVRARDIVGYTGLVMVAAILWISAALLLW